MSLPVPVYVIAGFLGSGKTTFLNHLLRNLPPTKKAAVIVNEFGKISIDGDIIRSNGFDVKELKGGCVCCTLRGDIITSLLELKNSLKPDLIVMETSGLAVPKDILNDLRDPAVKNDLHPEGAIILANASTYLDWSDKFFIINAQLKDATTVILNKCDLVDEKELCNVRRAIESVCEKSTPFFETINGKAPFHEVFPKIYFEKMDFVHDHNVKKKIKVEEHQHADSTNGFDSMEFETSMKVDEEKVSRFLMRFGKDIIRAKGTLLTQSGGVLLQHSLDETEVSEFSLPLQTSRMVIILEKSKYDTIYPEAKKIFQPELVENEKYDL